MVELGVMYAAGTGVPKDQGEARKYFERAAAAGNARGASNLVALSGSTGDTSDPAQARALLAKAADANSAEAQFQLGLMMAQGLGGPQDDVGARAMFEKAAAQRIPTVLALPGWMAAQRFQVADTPGRPSVKPKYLTVWETEGVSAQVVNETLQQGLKNAVKDNPAADMSTAEIVYWEPITPYITKDDFVR